MAAFELSCLLVIFIIFVNAPAAPVLETLGPQVNPTLAVSSGDAETMSTCQPGCRAIAIFGHFWTLLAIIGPLLAIIDHYWLPGGRAIANILSLCLPRANLSRQLLAAVWVLAVQTAPW